ncbi:hypothetical protein GCM10009555_078210 [Acrocarpospora macrocephala]|uniref:Uncharacterized protein n=1 Tax=Acrocarpospora macrocephala TaxID=150177 RepID=A0A5M3X455_9ACTN|nr:hypothetical protein Amac_100850 [Acrocarpospora macrocephala]
MARPKIMPTSTIGIMLMIGPVCCRPIRPAPQPHWKTATTAPSEASTDSRKPKTALSGTITERKITSSSRKARPSTIARYGTSASCTFRATSMFTAVVPVTRKVAPVPYWVVHRG